MSKPVLYIFTISHYCEKARWALTHLGIDAEVRILAPGTHLQVAQGLGLKRGSVPFLQDGDRVIQGSDEIISWAEKQAKGEQSLGSHNQDVLAIEKRLDDKLGVHIRRWFYSEAIIECPHTVKPIFMEGLSIWEKVKLTIKWPVICKLMIKRMDLGYQQGLESLAIVEEEITWLESLIDHEDSFLVGDSLTRADIAAASLLAPLVGPMEYSCSKLMTLPPRAIEQSVGMDERVFWRWVNQVYHTHRER
ncbi:hypothetical protein NBRC116583_16750 [Arenicella sp. 4NH20-0111]|uniref:glutathione S-transferase family protein n=1 Tax=Arenicella sp. 4NH20-0111 TaxID=3127648 RepID=UPI003109880C